MAVANAQVDLDVLKSRYLLADLVEAAGIQLRGRGRVRQGVCPFHDEAEGSFTVYGDTERFHCFGCGATGDVLDFVQRTEGLSLPEAIRRLGGTGPAVERAGPVRTAPTPWPPHTAVLPPRDTAVLTAAVRFYAGQLRCSPQAQAYLASRGVGPATAMRLGLGYAPGRGLREYMESQGFTAERLMTPQWFPRREPSGLRGWLWCRISPTGVCGGSRAGPETRPARQGSSPSPAPSRCWDWGDWGRPPDGWCSPRGSSTG